MEESGIVVFCTFPNNDEAKSVSKMLVEKNLAACCSIIPKIISIYRWESKLEESEETFVIIKTIQKCYDQLEKEIKMLHSYSVPEIISLNINNGSKAYLDWLIESTNN